MSGTPTSVVEAEAYLRDQLAVPLSELTRLIGLLDGPDYAKSIKHLQEAVEALRLDMQITCLFLAVIVIHGKGGRLVVDSSSAGESS